MSTPAETRTLLRFTSMLGESHRDELEELLFFHPHQGNLRKTIVEGVEKYGSPKVIDQNGGLRVQIPLLPDAQTLYAVLQSGEAAELAGVVVYTRMPDGILEVLHIVVKEGYSYRGKVVGEPITFALLDELIQIGRRIQGVTAIRVGYHRQGHSILRPVRPIRPQAAESQS